MRHNPFYPKDRLRTTTPSSTVLVEPFFVYKEEPPPPPPPPKATPDEVKAPEPPKLEVPSGTSFEIVAWVDGDKERAKAALEQEEKGETPRKTLIRELNKVLESEST